jgi:hypothetical protein
MADRHPGIPTRLLGPSPGGGWESQSVIHTCRKKELLKFWEIKKLSLII